MPSFEVILVIIGIAGIVAALQWRRATRNAGANELDAGLRDADPTVRVRVER